MTTAEPSARFLSLAIPLLLLGFVFSGGCASIPEPTANVVGVRFTDLKPDSLTLNFDTAIENHYPLALPLASLEYSLASGGKPLLSGSAPIQGSVPANGKSTVPLPANLNFAQLMASSKDIRPGMVIPYDASLTLSVNAPLLGKMSLPLKKSGQLPIPAIPKVEVSDVQWNGLDFNRTTATVHLHVTNTNQFALDLTHISLGLSLGGHSIASAGIDQPTSLPAGGDATMAVPIGFSPKDLGLSAFELIKGKGAGYHITGLISAGTPFGPLSFPYDNSGSTSFR